jgi:hypothetical protein
MKLTLFFSVIIIFLVFQSCDLFNQKEIIFLGSKDKSQWVTHISMNNVQYIIAGRTKKIPDTNYVYFDVSHKDLEVDNYALICWTESCSNKQWEIVIDDARILENKLDSSQYIFQTKIPLFRGIPSDKPYLDKGCHIFEFDEYFDVLDSNLIIERL